MRRKPISEVLGADRGRSERCDDEDTERRATQPCSFGHRRPISVPNIASIDMQLVDDDAHLS